MNLDESMKNLIQAENYVIQINWLEAQINRSIKDRDEKTLPNIFSTICDCPSHNDRNEESGCLEDFDQDSSSSHQFELDQSQPLDQLASFNFNEIELDRESEPDHQLCDLVSNVESMLTSVSLPNLDSIPEPALTPIPIYYRIESLIVDGHIPYMMNHECDFKFFDLEPTLELDQTLEPKLIF